MTESSTLEHTISDVDIDSELECTNEDGNAATHRAVFYCRTCDNRESLLLCTECAIIIKIGVDLNVADVECLQCHTRRPVKDVIIKIEPL